MVPIVLQTYNRVEYSMQVIPSLYTHILYPHYVVVVDNGSTDGTVEYLKFAQQQGLIKEIVFNNENKGISEAKNQGLEVVSRISKEDNIEFICITDNDIIPPFIREKGCVLQHIVDLMTKNQVIGMCGVDLSRENAPVNQEWWWRLRQHYGSIPEFAEISIGFWFAVIRYSFFKDFRFVGESIYGRADESIRNFITLQKKSKIGLLKGVYDEKRKETVPKLGVHLGWIEDCLLYPDYVNFKKQERAKAEVAWKEKNRKW